MTVDFDYPPERSIEFATAAEQQAKEADDVADDVADQEETVRELQQRVEEDGDGGAVATELQQAREHLQTLRAQQETAADQRDALRWAVSQWGDDASITLRGITTGTRARIQDTVNATQVGDIGEGVVGNYALAAGIVGAPFFEGDTPDLETRVEYVAALPPELADWIDDELNELMDLGEGN
jgi:hypothetical protein